MNHWNLANRDANPMVILREIFETATEKSTIELKAKCSDCGGEVILAITRTSGGYGLIGGALLKGKDESWLVKCADCYKANLADQPLTVNRITQGTPRETQDAR